MGPECHVEGNWKSHPGCPSVKVPMRWPSRLCTLTSSEAPAVSTWPPASTKASATTLLWCALKRWHSRPRRLGQGWEANPEPNKQNQKPPKRIRDATYSSLQMPNRRPEVGVLQLVGSFWHLSCVPCKDKPLVIGGQKPAVCLVRGQTEEVLFGYVGACKQTLEYKSEALSLMIFFSSLFLSFFFFWFLSHLVTAKANAASMGAVSTITIRPVFFICKT
jgi:hypothetical protein